MNVKTYQFSEKELQAVEKALDMQFSEQDKERLRYGQFSSLLQDHIMPDKSIRNVKIRFARDKEDVVINYREQKETLFIPDVIAGKRLSGKDKQTLIDQQVLQIKVKGKNLYIQIDKDLNAVTVSTDFQIGIPDKIGDSKGFDGYVLNDTDKKILANGGKIPPKLMCGEQGFFLASVSLTPEKTGYTFYDYRSVPENKVNEYIEKYNKSTAPDLSQIKNPINQDPNKKIHRNLDTEFFEAVEKKDFIKLNNLSDEGYKPAEEKIKNIATIPGLSENDRIAIEQLFDIKVEPDRSIDQVSTKIKIDKSKTNEQANVAIQAKDLDTNKRSKKDIVGNIINTAFRDIGS